MTDREAKEKMMEGTEKDIRQIYKKLGIRPPNQIHELCDHLIRKGWRKGEMK